MLTACASSTKPSPRVTVVPIEGSDRAIVVPAPKLELPAVDARSLDECEDLPKLAGGERKHQLENSIKTAQTYGECRDKHRYLSRYVKTLIESTHD